MEVKYNKDTQQLINEAARLWHLLNELVEGTHTTQGLLSDAIGKLPPGSLAGYLKAIDQEAL